MSSSKTDKYNKIQVETRKFYEEDNLLLINLIITKGWMSQHELAKYLNLDHSTISKKLTRYQKENS